jgi:hypothetical protein
MEGWPCRLVRGGVELGTITHDPREDGGCCEVAWLEPTPAFESIRHLFAEEFRLLGPLCEAETGSAAATELWSKLAAIQREILEPGVQMIRLDHGEVIEADELHIEGLKVFWR